VLSLTCMADLEGVSVIWPRNTFKLMKRPSSGKGKNKSEERTSQEEGLAPACPIQAAAGASPSS